MARDRHRLVLVFARIWAYPLWGSVIRSDAADAVATDVDWWMRCIGDADLLALDRYSRFAYLVRALTEFSTRGTSPGSFSTLQRRSDFT
jgi:serine O-acetyltransferase